MGADKTIDLNVSRQGSWLFQKDSIILAPIWLCTLLFGGIWIEEIRVSANAVKSTKIK